MGSPRLNGVTSREAALAHREAVRGCSRCFPEGGNAPVADRAKDPRSTRAMLVGQAPGITEVTTRAPFTGPAGKRLALWLQRAGIAREDLYFSAVARCFPGKAKGGDKVPSRAMILNCRPHLEAEFALYRPEVVVLIGGLAIKEVLGIKTLAEAVGRGPIERDGVNYLPLPHPSGASTWLNDPANKARLEESLRSLRELMEGLKRENAL